MTKKNTSPKHYLVMATIVIISIVGWSFVSSIKNSLFFTHPDRVNVVFYGQHTTYFSLSTTDTLHYEVSFYPDLKITVPGGFDLYRVGGIGKLVSLEKDPSLYRNTFSLATSTFVDYYFYPQEPAIYYGSESEVVIPSIGDILFSQSNASIVDRLYLSVVFLGKTHRDFSSVDDLTSYRKNGDKIFSREEFTESAKGYLYQDIYRTERKNVQILYQKDWPTAQMLSEIIEGNGISIADITQSVSKIQGCVIKENISKHSYTAQTLAKFFNCRLEQHKTGIYDILFEVGEREEQWEVVESSR